MQQQLVLLLREVDPHPGDRDQPRAPVDPERAGDDRRGGRAARAPQHGAHPLDELVVVEGPREVVVAAAAKRAHAFARLCLGGADHDHRRLATPPLEVGIVAREHQVGGAPGRCELEAVVRSCCSSRPRVAGSCSASSTVVDMLRR